MKRAALIRLGLCLAVLMTTTAAAFAQSAPAPKPVQITDFPLPTVERLGLEIYLQDQLAWRASDALTDGKYEMKGIKGWVVIPQPPGFRVRFVRETPAGFEAAYDVVFDGQKKSSVSRPQNAALSGSERAQFEATMTARRDVPSYCVNQPYNTIVLPNAEGGWLVWLLEPMTKANTYPITGHWRYLISENGKSITRRDRLGNSCLSMPKETKSAALMVGNIVSQAPLETHVFTNYAAKLDLFVVTGEDGLWRIHDGKISSVDPKTMAPSKP